MKSPSRTLCLLLGITGLAHGAAAKKHADDDAPAVTHRAAPKNKPPAAKTADDSDDDIPDKPKPSHTKSASLTPAEQAVTDGSNPPGVKRVAAVSSIEPEELANFDNYAPQIQQLVRHALELTKLNLTYTFGSADPTLGGMDCSGTVVYLLNGLGFKNVPRQSDEICGWVQDRTLLHRVTTAADSLKHPEFSALQPGDLLFWSGTYTTAPRKIPVTHVMIYLGKLKKNGRPVVFGSSDGRAYQGESRTGVSVFDFSLPRIGGTTTFYGYGLIPAAGKIPVPLPPAPAEVADANVEHKDKPAIVTEPAESKKEPAKKKTDLAATQEKKAASQEEDVPPVVKREHHEPKVAATPKDDAPSVKEEVRRALPTGATGDDTPAPKIKPKPEVAETTEKPKVSKPRTAASKSSARRRAPPRELTAKEKFDNAANRVANSIRNAFGG